MKVIHITQDEAYNHLDQPFNPPTISDQLTEENFEKEWWQIRDGLKHTLDKLGRWNAYGEGDYYLGEQMTISRGIGIEITSDKMLNQKLVPAMQTFLSKVPEAYEIYFWTSEDSGEIWNFFITQDEIRTDAPDNFISRLIKK